MSGPSTPLARAPCRCPTRRRNQPPPPSEGETSMKMKSLPCPNCRVPIDLSSVQWCRCVTKPLSLVCGACNQCFCKLRKTGVSSDWTLALCELVQEQTEEKCRRALQMLPQSASPEQQTVLIVDDD